MSSMLTCLPASFGTNVLKLLLSKIATQAISFITAPIIARIFLPEHFGIEILNVNAKVIINIWKDTLWVADSRVSMSHISLMTSV
jgi:hypothetical protein